MDKEGSELLEKIGELRETYRASQKEKKSLRRKSIAERRRRALNESAKEKRGTSEEDLAAAQAQRHLQPIDINL